MGIPVTCPGCGRSFQVAEEHAGRRAQCPKCSTVLLIPAPPAAPPEIPSLGGLLDEELAPQPNAAVWESAPEQPEPTKKKRKRRPRRYPPLPLWLWVVCVASALVTVANTVAVFTQPGTALNTLFLWVLLAIFGLFVYTLWYCRTVLQDGTTRLIYHFLFSWYAWRFAWNNWGKVRPALYFAAAMVAPLLVQAFALVLVFGLWFWADGSNPGKGNANKNGAKSVTDGKLQRDPRDPHHFVRPDPRERGED